mmetsp:Transcript_8925/g.17833  ORF Transcript_8925/g.17833 Transcript_8925/m.17833 type:complete len:116 (+) Transcript_8925:57-404(+)
MKPPLWVWVVVILSSVQVFSDAFLVPGPIPLGLGASLSSSRLKCGLAGRGTGKQRALSGLSCELPSPEIPYAEIYPEISGATVQKVEAGAAVGPTFLAGELFTEPAVVFAVRRPG